MKTNPIKSLLLKTNWSRLYKLNNLTGLSLSLLAELAFRYPKVLTDC